MFRGIHLFIVLFFSFRSHRSIIVMCHIYSFTTENIWLSMSDGIRLSATLTIPSSECRNEKFPVLLEYKPYRKDDGFYNFNQPNIYYLARRGFIVAKVDIRGTGSSAGVLIEREYTSQELDDCEQVIEQLADHPRSNGRVGMYGLSWSAFNSLMMAVLRRPPALQAIFAAHGSEDLYKNDIHYADGILHLDEYILSVDHENALPATPDYEMNEQWINERFRRRPWLDIYLEHQLDGPFWREHSIKYAYENLTIPVYLLAGLYDGYKDFAINIYENSRLVSPKMKVVVGPFVHSMPEYSNRNPGPGFDGKAEMVRWFSHWLKDASEHSDIIDEPDITLFIRTSLTTGTYRYEPEWPISRQQIRRMFMSKERKLLVQEEQVSSSTTTTTIDEENEKKSDVDTLEYRPWIGFEAGVWWDSLTDDQRPFDRYCLIYDSDSVNETIEIVGFVKVSLLVSTTARLAHWVVRLEDVDIDGQVWLVTGTGLNAAHQQRPPAYLELNRMYTITFRLHFTTWTFLPGHRIRIAVSNAMLPAFWPSPYSMNTSIYLDPSVTFIELPVIPPLSHPPPPPPLFTQLQIPLSDIFPQSFSANKPTVFQKHDTDLATVITFEQISYELLPNGRFMSGLLAFNFTCSHLNPADVKWIAYARQVYVFGMHEYSSIDDIPMKNGDESIYPDVDLLTRRHFELQTNMILYSDEEYFYIDLKRQMFNPHGTANETLVKFVFNGKHKRQFQ